MRIDELDRIDKERRLIVFKLRIERMENVLKSSEGEGSGLIISVRREFAESTAEEPQLPPQYTLNVRMNENTPPEG